MNIVRKSVLNAYKKPFVMIYIAFMLRMIKIYVKPIYYGAFVDFFIRMITVLIIISPIIVTTGLIYCMFRYCDKQIMLVDIRNREKALCTIESKLYDISECAHEQLYDAIRSDDYMPKNDKSQFIVKYGKRLDDIINNTMKKYESEDTNGMSYGLYDFSEFIESIYSNVMTVCEFEPVYIDGKRVFTQYVYNCDGHGYNEGRFEIYRMIELINIEEDVQIYVCHRENDVDNENDFVLIAEHYNPDLIMKLFDNRDVVLDDENYGFGVAFGKYSKSITFGKDIDDTICYVCRVDTATETFSHILNIIQ